MRFPFKSFFIVIRDSFIFLWQEIKFKFVDVKDVNKNVKKVVIDADNENLNTKIDSKEEVKKSSSVMAKVNQDSSSRYIKQLEKNATSLNVKDSSDTSSKNLSNTVNSNEDIVLKNLQNNSVDTLKNIQDRVVQKKITKKAFFARILLVLSIFFIIFCIYIVLDVPRYDVIENYEPSVSTRMYSADGYLISEFATEKRLFVPIDEIPQSIIDAFTSAEDKNFFDHNGFDFQGIARASVNNIKYIFGFSNNLEGASTISQQVSKNFFLTPERTLVRKIKEAYITFRIEQIFSKDYILELYLNEIYLGRGAYGVSMAAQNYFNKSITDLNTQEAAFLAALPKAPARYDPKYSYNEAKSRRNWVLGRMLADNKLSQQQYNVAVSSEVEYSDNNEVKDLEKINNYASEEIRRELLNTFTSDEIYSGGLVIKTSVNNTYQKYSYDALRRGLERYDTRLGYQNPVYRGDNQYMSTELLSNDGENTSLWFKIFK